MGYRWGSKLVNDGDVSFYQFMVAFMGVYFSALTAGILFSFSSSEFFYSIGTVYLADNWSIGFTKANDAMNYFFWLSELQPTIAETAENQDVGPIANCSSYDMKDVQFSYPLAPETRVLRGLSMTVSACAQPF